MKFYLEEVALTWKIQQFYYCWHKANLPPFSFFEDCKMTKYLTLSYTGSGTYIVKQGGAQYAPTHFLSYKASESSKMSSRQKFGAFPIHRDQNQSLKKCIYAVSSHQKNRISSQNTKNLKFTEGSPLWIFLTTFDIFFKN